MATIVVRVKPRSSRQAILGLKEGVWQIALNSPPEGGKANAELLKLIAKTVGVSRSQVQLVSGPKSRDKRIEVSGLADDEAVSRLTDSSPS